jgi:hypothetical protein
MCMYKRERKLEQEIRTLLVLDSSKALRKPLTQRPSNMIAIRIPTYGFVGGLDDDDDDDEVCLL